MVCVYCICAKTTLPDEVYALNYIDLYHVATFEGNFILIFTNIKWPKFELRMFRLDVASN